MGTNTSVESIARILNATQPRRSTARLKAPAYPKNHGPLPSRPYEAAAADRPLDAYALDPRAGIFRLRIRHDGYAVLALNDAEVASLNSGDGSAILKNACCPFERAADFVAALRERFPLNANICAEFEFKVARWIPEYFDL